jgi:hypothetical protein
MYFAYMFMKYLQPKYQGNIQKENLIDNLKNKKSKKFKYGLF